MTTVETIPNKTNHERFLEIKDALLNLQTKSAKYKEIGAKTDEFTMDGNDCAISTANGIDGVKVTINIYGDEYQTTLKINRDGYAGWTLDMKKTTSGRDEKDVSFLNIAERPKGNGRNNFKAKFYRDGDYNILENDQLSEVLDKIEGIVTESGKILKENERIATAAAEEKAKKFKAGFQAEINNLFGM